MHGDEANQAVKAGLLLETGSYVYDPREHHGPTLYFLTLPSMALESARTLADTDEFTFRILPVLFGAALVLLVWPLAGGLGRAAALAAGVLTALSPAMVFYSRYYVQEMLLVAFTFGAIVCGYRYARSRRLGWLIAAGACLGLMHATKETWIFAATAMAAGLAMAALWARCIDGRPVALRFWISGRHLAVGALAAAVVSATLFSSFFTHLRGPLDSVLAYVHYAGRAGGAGLHDKPWHYYLDMLACSRWVTGATAGPWWSEGLILGLAAVGVVAALARRGLGAADPSLARFLAFYTIVLAALYAAIPYKTPWCVLSFLHGMILLAGLGAAALVRWTPTRPLKAVACVVLAALAAQLGWQAYRASFPFAMDQRNPYVYAHPSRDILALAKCVQEAAAVAPEGHDMIIKVITPENYWPVPWYLRDFNPDHVGYYHEVPDDADAAVIITSPEVQAQVDAHLKGAYSRQSIFGLRPGVLAPVYVRDDLWQAMQKRRAER